MTPGAIKVAKQYATVQMPDEEIAVQLHTTTGVELAVAYAWVAENSDLLDVSRIAGRATIRMRLWDHGMNTTSATGVDMSKLNGGQLSTLHRMAEQHLGWTREPIADKIAKAVHKELNKRQRGEPLKPLKIAK